MSLALYDRVRETTGVLGTSDAVLLGAVIGYQSFAVVGNTNTCYYTIADSAGNWEVGLGTYSTTGPTLARTTVLSSSNANAKVSFPAGVKDVFLTYPAEKAVALDAASTIATGSMLYGNGTTSYSSLALGTNGYILQSNGTAPTWVAASTIIGGAGGANTQVQYNNAGALAGSANMTFNGTSLTLANDATIAGLTVGQGFTATGNSTAIGNSALPVNTGAYNTAVGFRAMFVNVGGTQNTAVGLSSLYSNVSGSDNVAVGVNALFNNVSGSSNTVVGWNAAFNQTGGNNTAIGAAALNGQNAGTNTGQYNVAVGQQTLGNNTTANNNTAVGYQAGYSNTTGKQGVFVGYQAGYNSTADANTFVGLSAGYNSSSPYNTFIGANAGLNSTGQSNCFIGPYATVTVAGGAGQEMTTGSNNIIIGGFSGNNSGLDIRTASNYIVLSDGQGNPNAYMQTGGGWYQANNSASWSVTSDARLKENVTNVAAGVDVIKQLRPVEFDFIADGKHDVGFIAQEYQQVLPAQVTEKEDGYLSITQNLVPYLVKAIQELSAEVDALKAQLGAK